MEFRKLYFVLILGLIGLSSCSKEDDFIDQSSIVSGDCEIGQIEYFGTDMCVDTYTETNYDDLSEVTELGTYYLWTFTEDDGTHVQVLYTDRNERVLIEWFNSSGGFGYYDTKENTFFPTITESYIEFDTQHIDGVVRM